MEINVLKKIVLYLALVFPAIVLVLVREFFKPNYFISSLYKIIFLLPILFGMYFYKKKFLETVVEHFSFKKFKESFWKVFFIGILLSAVYYFVYILVRPYLDVDSIVSQLDSFATITAGNIILIGAYLIILNSILEEYFWRGFFFNELRNVSNIYTAHFVSALGFALHHAMFFYAWFNIGFVFGAFFGLMGFSVVMNLVFVKYKNLCSNWMIHAFVDVVQIGIALNIFGII